MKRTMALRTVAAMLCVSLFVAIGWMKVANAAGTKANVGYYPGTMFHMMQYVADAKGFYQKAGLDLRFSPIANGPLMNTQMAAGAIDIGYSAPSVIGIAQEQGLDIVFVAGNVTMPWTLVARSDLKLPNAGRYPDVIRDLKGMKWGVYGRASDGEMFMRVMATEAGLNPDKDITWIAVGGPPSGLPALKARTIDVYLTFSPAPEVATATGIGKVLLDLGKGEGPGEFKDIAYQGVVVTRKYAQAKPEVITALIDAHSQAYCWAHEPRNFDELVQIVKAKLPVDGLSDEEFRGVVKDGIGKLSLRMPGSQYKVWNDMLVPAKLLKAPASPDQQLWKTVPSTEPKC